MSAHGRRTISMAGLLGAVLFFALSFAAIAAASRIWFGLTFLSYLMLISVATVGAIVRTGSPKTFWLAFAIFGWAFFLQVFMDRTDRIVGNPLIILAQDLSESLISWSSPEELVATTSRIAPPNPAYVAQMRQLHCEKVMLNMIGISVAMLCGFLSQVIYRVRVVEPSPNPPS